MALLDDSYRGLKEWDEWEPRDEARAPLRFAVLECTREMLLEEIDTHRAKLSTPSKLEGLDPKQPMFSQ